MLDAEAVVGQAVVIEELGALAHAALEVLVVRADLIELLQEGGICDRPGAQTLLVQHGHDPIGVLGRDGGVR